MIIARTSGHLVAEASVTKIIVRYQVEVNLSRIDTHKKAYSVDGSHHQCELSCGMCVGRMKSSAG
jgi:hypothetical protein